MAYTKLVPTGNTLTRVTFSNPKSTSIQWPNVSGGNKPTVSGSKLGTLARKIFG